MENEIKVRLIVSNFLCDFDEITNILDIKPTAFHKKDDLITQKGIIKYKQNLWIYQVRDRNIPEIGDLVSNLINIFKLKEKNFDLLSPECDIEVSIVAYLENDKPGIHFSKNDINFIKNINAEIDIDIY